MEEEQLEIVTTIEGLKDKFREAKLRVGDLRGLKNRFELTKRFGLPALQTFFYAAGGNGSIRMEVYADVTLNGAEHSYWCYNMKDLIDEVKDAGDYEIIMYYCKWNKQRTDADRERVAMRPFIYRKAQ